MIEQSEQKKDDDYFKALYADVDFSYEVKAFIKSNVGQYLLGRAEQDRDGAVEQLKNADPEDSKTIRGLQNTIKRAESIQYWMADAIDQGKNAEKLLMESSGE